MRLERNEGKLSRYVLRGGGCGNVASLPDLAAAVRFRRAAAKQKRCLFRQSNFNFPVSFRVASSFNTGPKKQ